MYAWEGGYLHVFLDVAYCRTYEWFRGFVFLKYGLHSVDTRWKYARCFDLATLVRAKVLLHAFCVRALLYSYSWAISLADFVWGR